MSVRSELRAGWSLFWRDMIKIWREKTRVISALTMPMMFLGVFGLGLRDVFGADSPFQDLNYIQYIFPGILGTTVLGLTVNNGVTIVQDREFGFLREVLVSPVSRLTIALSKVASGAGSAIVQVAVLLLIAPLVGLTPTPQVVVLLLGAVALMSVATGGLGVLIASRVKSTVSFQYLFQFMIFPLFFLSGAFFVLDRIPVGIRIFANINPLTYAIDLFRHILYSDVEIGESSRSLLIINSPAQDVLIIGIISAVLLAASAFSFSRMD